MNQEDTQTGERVVSTSWKRSYKNYCNIGVKENTRSERVMQKNGIIKEAEHIDYEWHDGRMKTRLEYRLLKKEWGYERNGKL